MDYISLMVLAMQTQLKKQHQKNNQKKNPTLTAVCFFLYLMTYLAHS